MSFGRKPPDEILLRIENFQLHGVGRRREEIINHRATRRILARGLLGRKWRAGEGVVIHPNCRSRTVKPRRFPSAHVKRLHLAKGSDVIENPERTPVRGNDQVVAVDREIPNSGDRQIQLQGLPMIAIVKGYVDAEFGSGEQEALGLRVFAHGA